MTAIQNWTPDRLPSLKGKTFAITGANSGIGFAAGQILSQRGSRVILLCRSKEKADAAASDMREMAGGDADLDIVGLDLTELSSVREAASQMSDTPLDGLILNAGVMAPPQRKTTADGFELQIGVNHLGHFLLAGLLAENVLRQGGRFVSVSSNMHKAGQKRIRFEDLHWQSGYRPMSGYAQSKLANALFIRALNNRLKLAGQSEAGFLCHPGYAATSIQNNETGPFMRFIMNASERYMAQSAAEGAFPTVLAAAELDAKPGVFYGPTRFFDLNGPVGECALAPQALDDQAAARLWEISEDAVDFKWTV